MKKILLAAALVLLVPFSAYAQQGPTLGVDAEVVLPVGNLGDAAGVGFGGLLRYEFTVVTRANITARAGFVYHTPKSTPLGDLNLWSIPLLAGIRFAATPSLYVAAEIGAFVNHISTPLGSDTSTKLGGTIGAGYRLGGLDLRLGLAIIDLGQAGDSLELFGGVGYNF